MWLAHKDDVFYAQCQPGVHVPVGNRRRAKKHLEREIENIMNLAKERGFSQALNIKYLIYHNFRNLLT